MNATAIPRLPEISLDDFDDEYRRAEVECQSELEKMIPELEIAAGMAPRAGFDFFTGGRKTALDIGCGTGNLPFLLAQLNPNATVIGVDLSEESIAYAKAHYEPKVDNLSYHVGSVENLGEMFHDIDMITCVGAMHHFPSLDSAIDQIMQALSDDGIFLLSDLNRENLRSLFSDKEFRYLESVRKLSEKVRNNKLRRQGYTKGEKMRRFLTLMSFQAAYTPAEVSAALGSRYGFKGRMAGVNYLLAVYKL
jgi:2-polyprenyl-3-methyl-5-hydroxy-6-metoxy-1,4-benzoquinol methylase